jgi:predicted transcriptional regulator
MERSSLHIDLALMRNLEVEAKRQRRSPSRLAGEAIEVMLRNCAEKRVAIRAAIDEAKAGSFVSEEATGDGLARDDFRPAIAADCRSSAS